MCCPTIVLLLFLSFPTNITVFAKEEMAVARLEQQREKHSLSSSSSLEEI